MMTSIFIGSAAIVIALVIWMVLPTRIVVGGDSIKIGRIFPIEILLQNVESVRLSERYPVTTKKVFGADSGDVKKGLFSTPDGPDIRLNISVKYPPFIEVIHTDGLFVFNHTNSVKTKELYRELQSRLE